MSLLHYAKNVIERFPKDHIKYAFCYGSGAFQQQGSDISKNMLDFIVVTADSHAFHKDNLKKNRKDYSFVKHFGSTAVNSLQGHGVYFNTLVPYQRKMIKYGVINSKDFVSDLLDWTSLYVSGRLHKPVLEVYTDDDPSVHDALRNNLESAVHCALLRLGDTFTEEELFMTISDLSYSGDFRMTIGEDKNKVQNIVMPNLENFRNLYENVLSSESRLVWDKETRTFEQMLDYETRFHHLNHLPWKVLERLVDLCNTHRSKRDIEEVIRILARNHSPQDCTHLILKSTGGLVRTSSFNQTIRSAITAGVGKSIKYALAKLVKMARSQKGQTTQQ